MASKTIPTHQPPFGSGAKAQEAFASPDQLRTAFALAMSYMYRTEVPLYGDLIDIVETVNKQVFETQLSSDSLKRLTLERHGAIRLGLPSEIHTVRRIFALLGMRPVGYYDLSAAGLPMHATCFRPVDHGSLMSNPFRVFTTLLRPELVKSMKARDLALRLLSQRSIFSPDLLDLLNVAEQQGGLLVGQAEVFIREALKTFSWAPVAASTANEYEVLKAQHPILADIACFKTAHINHLTPRTLDINIAQNVMREKGMQVKDRIEGPPQRHCPILLRQTSFLALQEPINFRAAPGTQAEFVSGFHKARFGEIEQRGAAVTSAGRKLYDSLLESAMNKAKALHSTPEEVDQMLADTFKAFPDEWSALRWQGLVFFEYRTTGKVKSVAFSSTLGDVNMHDRLMIEQLVEDGYLEASPITYEDFLPFSAAGIFQSNLGSKSSNQESVIKACPDKETLEAAVGDCLLDPDVLYAAIQKQSLQQSLEQLYGVD